MAFIGDAMVSKVLDELTSLAIEEIKQEVRLVVGVKDEVKKLTKNFQFIQAVLSDAEQNQLKEANVRMWLEDLKEVSYEMDDVLDEWSSAMLTRSQLYGDKHRTPSSGHIKMNSCAFIPSCCFRQGELGLRHDIARKIKDLNERLDDIATRKNNYGLNSKLVVAVGDQQVNRSTISDVDITEVKGRGEEEEKIVDKLLSPIDGAAVPHVVSIVGMGGLGKTTLAQLAYNNSSVQEHFDERRWVCVSDPFDETKVAKAILELGRSDESELQILVQNIKKEFGGKKFLLVLDDVWNEDPNKWKNLKVALMCCLPGSTILVTTRKDTVSKIMGCAESNIFRPGLLSKEECWSIIYGEVSLSGRTTEALERVRDIGYQIAEKCKGLPLAAKALGGLLRFKVSEEEWQSVLDSEMWKLGEEEVEIKRNLFASLWLSFHDLLPAERQCISYCAIVPKDCELEKKDLIKLWWAQGYLKKTKTKNMKMIGEEYLRNLCTRSFFQVYKKGTNGKTKTVKMHDIVHDFLQLISKKECSCGELDDNRCDSVRHLYYDSPKVVPTIYSFKKLRTLAIDSCANLDLRCLFDELTSLRSLALVFCGISQIPSTISRLVHLRLLNLSWNSELRELPESVCDLCNLLILDLQWCNNFKRMPHGIEKLSKLRYLYVDNFPIELTRHYKNKNKSKRFYQQNSTVEYRC